MAVEAVVVMVIQKVTDLLIQDAIFFDKVIDQVEDIRVQLRQMRGFLMDAEERENAEAWVKNYLKALYDVEDMVESYVLKLAHKKRQMGLFKSYGLFFHDWPAYWKLRREIKSINQKVKDLNKIKPREVEDASLKGLSARREDDHLEFVRIESDQYNRVVSSCSTGEDSDFTGFKEYVDELEDRLTSGSERIISVVGARGSGKTTLLRQMYNNKKIKKRFNCQAWIDVSEEHAVKDLLLGIWNQVHGKKRDREIAALEDVQLKAKLLEFLQGKRYLIVLDDARKQPDVWRELIDAFPDDEGNGSRVLLISHKEDITTDYSQGETLHLKPLEDKEAWKLFTQILRQEGKSHPFAQTTLQARFLEICQGLPLDIMLLGGLLSSKRVSYGEWTRLVNQANRDDSKPEIWLLSYNDLPANYKLCLLYMVLFPKEFDISVRRILRLWVAEGFIRHSDGGTEDLAEECFNNLVSRNLIKISKFRSDGGPKKCRLPGFLRENLSPLADKISLFHIHNTKGISRPPDYGVRRIVEYADIKDYTSNHSSNPRAIMNLRSYLSFNFPRYDVPANEVGNFLSRIVGKKGYGMLRVLDLEGVYKPILPSTLKHLLQLRYLGLRWTFLDTLPESVGDLPYLETLDLKRTYVNNLPSSVWKLQHLRHLYLPQLRLNADMQQPSSKLLTLWGLVVNEEHDMKHGLAKLDDLRELGITCRLKKFDELNEWITRLTRLQTLSLTSKDDMDRPSDLSLNRLSGLGKLSHLKLLGKLSRPLTEDRFPPNLKVLTLSVSHLADDPMPTLSQLPCVAVLRLLAKSYLGQKMHCPKDGFKHLRTLKMWMLEELQELTVQKGGMPHIRELNIRHCPKLNEIPSELLMRDALELILDDMPELEGEVRNHKDLRAILTVNAYTFSPLPWEKDDRDPELWR